MIGDGIMIGTVLTNGCAPSAANEHHGNNGAVITMNSLTEMERRVMATIGPDRYDESVTTQELARAAIEATGVMYIQRAFDIAFAGLGEARDNLKKIAATLGKTTPCG